MVNIVDKGKMFETDGIVDKVEMVDMFEIVDMG